MTKQRILETASEEFSKHGYDAVSMNDLVKILGINKATVYYHFKDKQSLYQEVLNSVVVDVLSNLQKDLKDAKDPKEKFKIYINSTIEKIKKQPFFVSLFMREMANFGSNMDESIVPLAERKVALLKGILKELPLKKEYQNIDEYAVFVMIHGTIHNFYAIQMGTLPFGGKAELKLNPSKTLDYIGEFISNMIISAICEEEK